jgi:hypothetical protein
MQEKIERLKSLKNTTQEKFEDFVNERAYNRVVKDLTNINIDVDDLTDDEFMQLLSEEIQKTKIFIKGVFSGLGIFIFLDLLG